MSRPETSSPLRALPSVDALLRTDTARELRDRIGADHLTDIARAVTEELRLNIQDRSFVTGSDDPEQSREALLKEATRRLKRACVEALNAGVRRVINATGVIIHTNLGRAPLSTRARRAVAEEAAGYCTLEYDTRTGRRGRRGANVEATLARLCEAEDALVVNNCAAAALLILTAFARDGETIVSRGELVEIGGDFRVPDVMAQSGARLVEVGTTNRTRLLDYRKAITPQTRLVMRVHPSNYRIVGFTSTPSLLELAEVAHAAGLWLYEDAGSGALIDFATLGVTGEPIISESIRDGADIVSFSGDKLLGSSQAGLIVGRRDLIDGLRRHPLYRALRADKLALVALEATLGSYRRGTARDEIPVMRMLALTPDELEKRARDFVSRATATDVLRLEVVRGRSAVGGGAAPTTHPLTSLIALTHSKLTASDIENNLREFIPPVIARVADGKVLLDLRTVAPDEEEELLAAISGIR